MKDWEREITSKVFMIIKHTNNTDFALKQDTDSITHLLKSEIKKFGDDISNHNDNGGEIGFEQSIENGYKSRGIA